MTRTVVMAGLLVLMASGWSGDDAHAAPGAPSNILFVIMDDAGIDQMRVFGYGGATPPSTPNLAQIANEGIRFHNTWAMPACSTSRAVFFTARFPFRTNVLGALGPADLANSMVSPYEMTTPKLLATKGYDSALLGKFHLALQGNNSAGYAMPYDLGWNYFAGVLDETGDPPSIDTTAGGVAPAGTSYSCGFVPGASAGGADSGACYLPDGSCRKLASRGPVPPGRTCRDQGGIFDPHQQCQTPRTDYLNFETLSGHYVSPLTYNDPDGSVDELSAQLATLLASQPACPGDGNIDLVVNQKDLEDWRFYSESWGLSSVYDLNLDGLTDAANRAIVAQNLGLDCRTN